MDGIQDLDQKRRCIIFQLCVGGSVAEDHHKDGNTLGHIDDLDPAAFFSCGRFGSARLADRLCRRHDFLLSLKHLNRLYSAESEVSRTDKYR